MRRLFKIVRVYALGSALVMAGFMTWFFWTLYQGTAWLVTPDEWVGLEFVLAGLSVITIVITVTHFAWQVKNDGWTQKVFHISDLMLPDFYTQIKIGSEKELREMSKTYQFNMFETPTKLILLDFLDHISWWSEKDGE